MSTHNYHLESECRELAERARRAARELIRVPKENIDRWLVRSAEMLVIRSSEIISSNEMDVEAAAANGLSSAMVDRLTLNSKRIAGMARGVRQIAELTNPIGAVINQQTRPNGLELTKVRVPLGVIFFIYESRPNVTVDAAALCVKSCNAVILRGGKEAKQSNRLLTEILRDTAVEVGLPIDAIQRVETTDRAAIDSLLTMHEQIDLAIPRGGAELIRRVVEKATMPVLKHFDGNCHVYVESSANLEQALAIIVNAKCQRMGVCNACESLLIDAAIADSFLPQVADALLPYSIELRGDHAVCRILGKRAVPATEQDWRTEFLGPILSVRVVAGIDEAIEHINHYGSRHTDAIITSRPELANQFALEVDTAAVMVNASTRFHDGYEFGLGAEIGISTDKFHARGPCGLEELTTYKYVVRGSGQVRTG